MGKYDDFKGQTFKIRNIIGEYLSTLTFKESHEIESVYNWDEDPNIKTTTATIGNANIKNRLEVLIIIIKINSVYYLLKYV